MHTPIRWQHFEPATLKAAAAVYLSQGEALLRDTLSALDAQLQPLRGQLAQLISAGYLLGMLSPPDGVVQESWLRLCWSRLAEHEQTRGMAVYLTTALSPVDRLYLNGGWCYGGFKAIPASGAAFARFVATGSAPDLIKPFALSRFASGHLLDEKGAGPFPARQ